MYYFDCVLHEVYDVFEIFVLTIFHSTIIHQNMCARNQQFLSDEEM
jgi:hypothetical protein